MAIVPDELVGLRVAVWHRRLNECPSHEPDLAGGVCVPVVEGERLGNQAAQPARGLPPSIWARVEKDSKGQASGRRILWATEEC